LAALVSLVQTLRLPEMRFTDRLALITVALRAWSRRPREDHVLSFPQAGNIHLARESLNADWNVFSEIFLSRCYNTDYRDAVVIDIGAHKGYYGAFALISGARIVISYEPERQNFTFLSRAASSFRDRGFDWLVEKKAIAESTGEMQLNVSGESWTHSLLTLPDEGPRSLAHVETVEAITLHEVLGDSAAHGSGRVVVKIDIEGEECDSILGTRATVWNRIDELFVETHPHAACTGGDITSHLAGSGLGLQPDTTVQITHLKR
jgi:FkbM family methyltransferase